MAGSGDPAPVRGGSRPSSPSRHCTRRCRRARAGRRWNAREMEASRWQVRRGRPEADSPVALACRDCSFGRGEKMTEPDKRMLWLRTLDAAAVPGSADYLESEFASEVLIPGLLVYRGGAVISRCTTLVADPAGLYKYALRLRLPADAAEGLRSEGTRKGYLFPDGPIGELIALYSLSLQARLYLVSTAIPPLGDDGVRLKTEHSCTAGPGTKAIRTTP